MVEINMESGGTMNGVSEGVNGHSDKKVKEHSSSKSSSDKHSSSKHSSSHDKHKDRHSHSSSKDKHSSSSSHKDKHRDKDREHKPSEHRDKDRHDKDRHDKDRPDKDRRDKDRHHDKDKHKSSSSSKDGHKDKHRSSSSSHKDKHRDKERSDGKEKTSESKPSESTPSESKPSESKPSEKSHKKDEHKDASTVNGNSHELSKSEPMVKDDQPRKEGYESEDDVPLTDRCDNVETKEHLVEDEEIHDIKEEMDDIKEEMEEDIQEENSDDELKIKEDADEDFDEVKHEEMDDDFDIKEEYDEDEDDKPLSARLDEDEDDKPLSARAKKAGKKRKMSDGDDEDDEDFVTSKKKTKKEKTKIKKEKNVKEEPVTPKKEPKKEPDAGLPGKGKKKKVKEEEPEKWKWWEEESKDDGTKWKFLEHKGPLFAPPYERLPKSVKFLYDGKEMSLTQDTEEVATFYGKMLNHDYCTMEVFNKNFFKDWRSVMTDEERKVLKDIAKCDFRQILAHFTKYSEDRKARSKEEKTIEKEKNAEIQEEYGFCIIDGHKEKIGNFRIEPPGLFRGRGSHPKMGMLKKRVYAEQVNINCSKDSNYPKAPDGHHWKSVQHDPQVTWLAGWVENVQDQHKYVMLNPSSKLKGEKDMQKYETARRLKSSVDSIRATYREDWKSKEMRIRQRAVALYFIDKLALRAGNEKDEDSADTVGCCSLRYEHIQLHQELDGKEWVVVFDFLGKDSIRYYNKVAVEKRVFKNLELFLQNKNEGDDIFDRLNTTVLNNHLQTLMDGLTAKVFRTYNASTTLQEQLNLLTMAEDVLAGKILSYNRANRKVAILCNHQRAVPKNFDKQMENMQAKISAKREAVKESRKDMKQAKITFKNHKVENNKKLYEKKKKTVERLEEQLNKLEVSATDKDENKDIALGTSKLNYLDPRISVAWSKKWDVPIDKIYNKTQREKFAWALAMAEKDYAF